MRMTAADSMGLVPSASRRCPRGPRVSHSRVGAVVEKLGSERTRASSISGPRSARASELADAGADKIAGPPFAVYHAFDPVKIDVEAAMPLRTPMEVTVGDVHAISIQGGPAVEVQHVGPYDTIGSAYFAIEEWLTDHQRARGAAIREVYLSEPTTPSDERVTLVIQPLQPA
ncbi:MAG: GyrI-like domain-containing protein [Proteobacteria bacterium]|nr:GyrI-like domain-containing protein [Pseudomonadota bacterium]